MLTSLRLKNFKKHAALEIHFQPGLNLITGKNYAGKSSVLHGILYALWGATAVPGGTSVIPRQGSEGTEVELEFELHGKSYLIQRKGQNASLSCDGQKIATSASNVAAEVERILGLDKSLFLLLKYGEQGETKALLTLGAAELNRIIEQVGAVELVDRVIERCGTVVTEAQGALDSLGPPDTESIDSLQEQSQAKVQQLVEMHAKITELTESYQVADANFVRAQQTERKWAAANLRRMEVLSKRQGVTHSLSEALQEEISLRDTLEGLAKELIGASDCEKTLATVRDQLQQRKTAMSAVATTIHLIDVQGEQVKAAETRLQQLRDSYARAGQPVDVSAASDRTATLKAEYEVAKAQLSELHQALKRSVCPTCKRPYDASHAAETQAKIDGQLRHIETLEPALRAAQDALQSGRERNEALRVLEREMDSVTSSLSRYAEDYRQYETRLAKYQADAARYPEERTLQPKLEQLEAENQSLQRKRGHQERTAISLQKTEERIQALRAEAAKLEEEEVPAERDLEMAKHLTAGAQKAKNRAEIALYAERTAYTQEYALYQKLVERLKHIQAVQEKRNQAQRTLATAQRLAKYLRSNRDQFMAGMWEGVLSYASAFAANCTGGEISAIQRTSKSTFIYVENGQALPISAASGGQKSIMGLGVQLGLAELLPGSIGTVLLDEPTAELDQERSLALSAILPTSGNQLLVVTHRALDTSAASAVVDLG